MPPQRGAAYLSILLDLVSGFARKWRLDFGSELLACSPTWSLSGQMLQTRLQLEHLRGTVLDSRVTAASHVDRRVKRARTSFYGLAAMQWTLIV